MKHIFICIIFIILFTNLVVALDCQYTEEIVNSTETKFMPFDNQGNELKEITIELNELWNQPAKIINPNPVDMAVNLKLNLNVQSKTWCITNLNRIISKELVIPANNFIELPTEKPFANFFCNEFRWNEIIEIQYKETSDVEIRLVEIVHKSTVCTGKKDDGAPCSSPNECGGGFCIEGHCSNSEICFNNDCKCIPNEIQCKDNKQCVSKNIIPLNNKPKCGLSEECISGYVDDETGLCAKSPAQIQEEENKRLKDELVQKEKEKKFMMFSIISLISLIILGGVVIYVLKNKNEKQKQKTIQKEIELEGKIIQRKEYELYELKKQIKEIEKQKNKNKIQIKELEKLKSTVCDLNNEIDKAYKKYTRPYPSKYVNRMVWRNPKLGCYECFYNKDDPNPRSNNLVHRWVWKKHNGRWLRPGYHLHHIDKDKYNNNPRNLEEIEGKEHYESHRRGF